MRVQGDLRMLDLQREQAADYAGPAGSRLGMKTIRLVFGRAGTNAARNAPPWWRIRVGGRKTDLYNHVIPRAVANRMRELAPGKGDMVKRVTSNPMLHRGPHRVFRDVRPAARAALVTHRLGAMIPCFEGRVGPLWNQLGSRTSDEDYTPILAAMTAKGRRPIDYFRFFSNDTAVGGAGSAIRCGLDFFSAAYYSPPAVRSIPKAVRCSSGTIAAIDALSR